MGDLDESFAKLLARQPTDAEKQELYHVRDALGLRNNDALWLVLMALEHYRTLYREVPGQIAKAASATLTEVQATADATMRASAEATKRDLTRAVEKTAHEVARNTSRKQMLKWAAGCVAVVALAMGGIAWAAREAGYQHGYATGYAAAQDEKAAAAWANTPEGKLAYRLAEAGSLRALATCASPGWQVDKGYCRPYTVRQGKDELVYGWALPATNGAR